MACASVHGMNLKGRWLEDTNQNIKIISEKYKLQTFFIKKIGRSYLVLGKMLTEIKCILSNLCISGAAVI